jgi:opacity protein-like surface antigen
MATKLFKILMVTALVLGLTAATASAGLVDEVAVGIRWKKFELTGDKNFTGTIVADTVDEITEWYPTNFNVLATFCPYGGVVFEYDRFGSVMDNDGKLFWDTFMLGVTVRHHFKKLHLAPYAVVGVTWNWVRFDENNWWRYGFSSPQDFDEYRKGRLPEDWENVTRRLRNMQPDNSFGWAFGFGVDIFITKHLALNLDARWNKADTDVHYRTRIDGFNEIDRHFTYDLDTVSYGVGLRWYF